MSIRMKALASGLCLSLAPFAAGAAPVTYNENVSGDLAGQSFALNLGANTVSGASHFFVATLDVDFDNFSFTIPTNTILQSVAFAFTTQALAGTLILHTEYQIRTSDALTMLSATDIDLLKSSPASLFSDELPLSDGSYLFFHYLVGSGPVGQPVGGTWDYTITLNVAAVPEPSALALFGAGLFGLAYWTRRRWLT